MKKLNIVFYLLLVAALIGCNNGGTTINKSIDSFATVIVEDCEYIYQVGTGYRSLVHKGNCKNPIHKCSCN